MHQSFLSHQLFVLFITLLDIGAATKSSGFLRFIDREVGSDPFRNSLFQNEGIKNRPTTRVRYSIMATTSAVATNLVAPPPGLGKWNRKKRLLSKKTVPSGKPKIKITKDERREKYTAIAKYRQVRIKSKNLVCFNCREKGHSVQHCPNAGGDSGKAKRRSSSNGSSMAGICYKCGSTEHALAACPKMRSAATDTVLPFATCFVCQGTGHLASTCPNNANGIYVNGGECKHCGSKQHRGTRCPEKTKQRKNGGGIVEEQDFSDLLEGGADDAIMNNKKQSALSGTPTKTAKKIRRVVNF